MWALLRLPRFGGAIHANGHDNRCRHRQIGIECRVFTAAVEPTEWLLRPYANCRSLSPAAKRAQTSCPDGECKARNAACMRSTLALTRSRKSISLWASSCLIIARYFSASIIKSAASNRRTRLVRGCVQSSANSMALVASNSRKCGTAQVDREVDCSAAHIPSTLRADNAHKWAITSFACKKCKSWLCGDT
jgi:hypothetical protein